MVEQLAKLAVEIRRAAGAGRRTGSADAISLPTPRTGALLGPHENKPDTPRDAKFAPAKSWVTRGRRRIVPPCRPTAPERRQRLLTRLWSPLPCAGCLRREAKL